ALVESTEPKTTVLVVDDDAGIRKLISAVLSQADMTVHEAESGVEALEILKTLRPNLVMLDVEMPELDGYQTCAKIKASEFGESLPVIMVTGYDDERSVARAYEAGAEDFIAKPVNAAALPYHVRYVLRSAAALREHSRNEEKISAILEAMPDLILSLDRNGNFVEDHAGDHAAAILGHSDLVGRNLLDVLGSAAAAGAFSSLKKVWQKGAVQTLEYSLPVDGLTRDFEARLVATGDAGGLAIVRDISDRKKAEDRIRFLAYNDPLTGLPNRTSFTRTLNHFLRKARVDKSRPGILFIDIDRFKRINDTLGHPVGDTVLIAIADRLRRCVPHDDSSDGKNLLARLGGDAFGLVLPNANAQMDPAVVAHNVVNELAPVFRIGGQEIFLTPSIGIAVFPDDGQEADTLVKNADAAVSHAKMEGRNTYQFFVHSMSAHSLERLKLEGELRKALEREEFFLLYQPQYDVASERITGVEALVRWQHPERGLVPPLHFIPLAEETGLILQIGDWVLQEACRQHMAWKRLGLEPLPVSVNISGAQFRAGSVGASVTQALEMTGMSAKYLELELTESVLMQDATATIESLQELRGLGIQFAVDDFGTGYSSLSYLKKFPLSRVKIDRSFVMDVTKNDDDAAIVRAIIAMAHGLHFETVAEGVETPDHLQFLRDNGCDDCQGYFFSKPISGGEIVKLLQHDDAEVSRAAQGG
ncbi:MAG: EAL domain-containing protein, partial [Pseudomonadota bacterium]